MKMSFRALDYNPTYGYICYNRVLLAVDSNDLYNIIYT